MKKIFLTIVAILTVNVAMMAQDKGRLTQQSYYEVSNGQNGEGFNYIQINELHFIEGDEELIVDEQYAKLPGNPTLTCVARIIGNGSKAISSKPEAIKTVTINAEEIASISSKAFAGMTNTTSFEIATATAPAVAEDAFPSGWATSCELTVPAEAYESYLAAWGKYFKSINGVDVDHTATAIEEEEAGLITAKVVGKKIMISEEAPVTVYSITGKVVFMGIADAVEVSGNGIYIVKTPNTTSKVVIK
ncbi:MAG: hypothetical protein MJZ15_05075 [Bacteroidales bacterium]|nr:hypothetical protein [Bacteroidales bacterium]